MSAPFATDFSIESEGFTMGLNPEGSVDGGSLSGCLTDSDWILPTFVFSKSAEGAGLRCVGRVDADIGTVAELSGDEFGDTLSLVDGPWIGTDEAVD